MYSEHLNGGVLSLKSNIPGGHHDVSDQGIILCIKVRQVCSKFSLVMSLVFVFVFLMSLLFIFIFFYFKDETMTVH